MRRVVVTGIGVVSPLGVGCDYNWNQLISGVSGISKISQFDVSDLPSKIAGFVPRGEAEHQFDADQILDKKEQRKVSDFILYAIAAADEAIKDAELDESEEVKENTGVIIGAGIGGFGSNRK